MKKEKDVRGLEELFNLWNEEIRNDVEYESYSGLQVRMELDGHTIKYCPPAEDMEETRKSIMAQIQIVRNAYDRARDKYYKEN